MKKHIKRRSLLDGYRVPGFKTLSKIGTDVSDPSAFVLKLRRLQKKRIVRSATNLLVAFMTVAGVGRAISVVPLGEFISSSSFGVLLARSVA
jgi:hypothetical protein